MNTRSTQLLGFVIATAAILSACIPQATTPSSQSATSTEPAVTQGLSDLPNDTESLAQAMAEQKQLSLETSYDSPAGLEDVGFTLTVDEEGVITDVQTDIKAKAPISITRQTAFAEELPRVLVGKKLIEIENVDRVGGSSLTTGAFNESLVKLKALL